MTTVEDRLIEIANYLPPQQKDDLAALVKCMSGPIVIAAAHFMGEIGIDPDDVLSDHDYAGKTCDLLNLCLGAAMEVEMDPRFAVSFSHFIRAGRNGDA